MLEFMIKENNLQSSKNEIVAIKLNLKDLEACYELDLNSLGGLWSKKQWKKELAHPKRLSMGVMKASKLVACCSGWFISDELHITTVAVHPDHKRQGLGKLVLKALINQGRFSGLSKVTLEVKDSNEPAKALYKSIGFEKAGYRKNFYKDGSDALILWLVKISK